MKKLLTKTQPLDASQRNPNLRGVLNPNLSGWLNSNLSGVLNHDLSGNISGINGDVTGITGNLDECGLTDEDRVAILGGTAAKLLGIEG